MGEQRLKRRDFLKLGTQGLLTVSGMLGLGGLLRYLSFQTEPAPRREIPLGAAADYPPGTRRVVADGQALLIHDEQGLRAISLVCTHLGCLVQVEGDGFTCPCHGSMYAADGALLRGPATQALHALRIEETENGELLLVKE
jgi:nitrite reductase/ring-hydroxylating ferredoxin subunit